MSEPSLILGVTGGIAVGKSTVVAELKRLGAAVVCADTLAREVVRPGGEVLRDLVAAFGPEVLRRDGTLNRDWLGRRIFADPASRERLNRITHPAIARLATERLREARASGAPLVIYDAPLLFEAGAQHQVDRVLVVHAAPEVQLQRLMQRDDLTEEEALRRIAAQWPQERKLAGADYRIDNSGQAEQTRQAVQRLYHRLAAHPPQ